MQFFEVAEELGLKDMSMLPLLVHPYRDIRASPIILLFVAMAIALGGLLIAV